MGWVPAPVAVALLELEELLGNALGIGVAGAVAVGVVVVPIGVSPLRFRSRMGVIIIRIRTLCNSPDTLAKSSRSRLKFAVA